MLSSPHPSQPSPSVPPVPGCLDTDSSLSSSWAGGLGRIRFGVQGADVSWAALERFLTWNMSAPPASLWTTVGSPEGAQVCGSVHSSKMKPGLVWGSKVPPGPRGHLRETWFLSLCSATPPWGSQVCALLSPVMNTKSLWAAARASPQEHCLSLLLLLTEVSATELPSQNLLSAHQTLTSDDLYPGQTEKLKLESSRCNRGSR